MWNKFVEIAQEPSFKRLVLAVLVSALLHAMLFGGMGFSLPFSKSSAHIINARLVAAKAPSTQTQPSPSPQVIPKPERPKQDKPPKAEPEPLPEPAPPIETAPPPPEVTPPVAEYTPPEPDPLLENTEPLPDAAALPLPDPSVVVNDRPYQYVETEFEIHTKIDGLPEGKGKITYAVDNESHYKLTSLLKPSGIASLIIPDLLQVSEGALTEGGLQPDSYLYKFGDKADKTYNAKFDWQKNTLQLTNSKVSQTVPLLRDSQDLLSFMYQFMHVSPMQTMQLNITNGKKLSTYVYGFEGEETIHLSLGDLQVVHISRISGDNDEKKTDLWLAIAYQYVPVKIRQTDKNGKLYELVATRLSTTPQATNTKENKPGENKK